MNKLMSAIVLAAVIFSSCSRNPVTGKKELSFISKSQEIEMGKSYDPQVVAQFGLYDDAKLQAFINEKGQEMAKISHRPNLNYEFKILNSPVVNAFAVPGGYVYFTRGIMAHFNNEAEFAGVLGHEIGHITARHSVKQQTRQQLGQAALIGGILVSKDFRQYAEQAQQAMGLLFMSYSRGAESQSDELGVDYSSAIGYDAVEMAKFYKTLQRLSDKSGNTVPTFLSTHPNPTNRFHDVTSRAKALQSQKPGNYAVNRNKYLKLIDGIMYGENPRDGFTENNVFYHPNMKFRFNYPSGWRLQNSPSMVQIAPSSGKAVINFSLAKGSNLQQIAREYAQKNNLRVGEQKSLNVNGFSAFAMISDYTSQAQNGQTNALRILTYFIQDGQYVYMFNGISTQNDFNSYFRGMQGTMESFVRLREASKLNKQPNIVRVRPVKRTGTLLQAFKDYGYSNSNAIRDMAILNGMEPNERVESGMLFKLIEEKGYSAPSTQTYQVPGNATRKQTTTRKPSGSIKID